MAYAVLAIAVMAFADFYNPNIRLGPLAVVPLLVIAYNTAPRNAFLIALAATALFGIIDYSTLLQQSYNIETMPVDTGVLGIALCSIVVTAVLLRRETERREQLQRVLERSLREEHAERERARTDPLTGVMNRRGFEEALEVAARGDGFAGRSAAIIFADVNGLKRINDSYGHDVGDEILRTVATRITGAVRAEDVVARIGGDEFVVLCGAGAQRRLDADRIAAHIAAALGDPILVGERAHYISASLGSAIAPEDGTSGAELLRVADRRMYERKAARAELT